MKKYLELIAKLLGVVGFLSVLALSCTRASLTSVPGNTATPTPTFTAIIINTPTNSPTRTFTNVDTSTPTNTLTNTPNGPTNTFTSTASSTATNTATNTQATNTFTNTATATVTNTMTNTPLPTNTFTQTASDTVTNTATNTQATSTFTNTATNTLTNTLTNTATVTSTNTITNTVTNTVTATITNTPGAGGSAFYLYQCGTFAAAPDYGSLLTGGTNAPNATTNFTGNPDNLDTTCYPPSGTGDNLDLGIPPSGAILPYVAIMPSTATVNLTGLTTCTFDAWCSGTTGFSFGAGIAAGDTTLNPITLSNTWTTYNITLPVADLSAAATMFYVNYTGAAGENLAVDQIHFH